MNKLYKIIILCLVVCMLVGICVACENTKYGPIGTTEDKDKEAVNNGGLIVQQGKYVYYVNGMDSTSNITKPEDNYFGKASVKGSIMKSEIGEDGTIKSTDVVVPKMIYTTAANGGIYVYGEWIYYLSPSTKTDNQSNVLVDQLVAARTKIDGTKTQEIATFSATDTKYVFTQNALVYYEGTELKKVGYSADSVDKKASTLSGEVSSVLFTEKSSVVFFVKATENDARQNNNVFAVVNGEVKEVVTDSTYEGSDSDLSKQYVFTLLSYDVKENVLYYTKAGSNSAASAATYGYKFGEDFSFKPEREKKFATSSLSTFVSLGFDNGLLDMSAAALKLYKPIAENAYVNDTETYATLAATGAKVVSVDDTYMYYVLSNVLYRIKYADKKAIPDKISDDTINTSWLNISVLDGYMYYIDNTYSYLFRMDLDSYNPVNNGENDSKISGEIVSGTRRAAVSKDEDGEITIKYVSDDANEEGVRYYQLPKFMTESDVKLYASALYDADEEEE